MGVRFRCCCRRRGKGTDRWQRLVKKVVLVQRARAYWAALGRFLQKFRQL